MPNLDSVRIFAYGSNLHICRMRARVPSAIPVAIGYVVQRRLAFHKRSVDGSAKADAAFSPKANDRVWGIVYQIDTIEKPSLDQHEFLGIGYDQQRAHVVTADGISIMAWMYVAHPSTIDKSLKPYGWYLEFVIQGAYQHRLPLCYIADLHRIEPTVDPDPTRDEANRRLLVGNTRR